MMRGITWMILLVGLFIVLAHVNGQYRLVPTVHFKIERWAYILYATVLGLWLLNWLYIQYRFQKFRAFRDIGFWLVAILLLVGGYGFKDELKPFGTRIMDELFPGRARSYGTAIQFRRAADGHFYVDAIVNRKPVRFLVDTGATFIVLSPADARKMGYDPGKLQYNRRTSTAGGQVWGARVDITSLRIGNHVESDMSGIVNSVEMEHSLLGMEYLRRLKSYKVEGDRMIFVTE